MLQINTFASSPGTIDAAQEANPAVCTIAALGFEPRMQNAMELLFKSRLSGRFAFTDANEADVYLIDLDSYGGRELWIKQAEAKPSQPMILLSMQEVEVTGRTYFVRKPLRPQDLIEALTAAAACSGVETTKAAGGRQSPAVSVDQAVPKGRSDVEPSRPTPVPVPDPPHKLGEELNNGSVLATSRGSVGHRFSEHDTKTFIGLAPDIDPKNPQQLAKAQFEPDAYLIGQLRQALKLAISNDRIVRLVLEHGSITLMPRTGLAVVDLQHFQLRTLAVVPLTEESSTLHFVDHFNLSEVPRYRIWQLESLLWSAALFASRGRVPMGTDITAKIRLKRWPNLTRLAAFPNVVRITAFLSHDPVSLVDAARILKVPQRCVFAFFTAAEALGLMEAVAKDQAPGKSCEFKRSTTPEKPVKRSLFRRILSHLRS